MLKKILGTTGTRVLTSAIALLVLVISVLIIDVFVVGTWFGVEQVIDRYQPPPVKPAGDDVPAERLGGCIVERAAIGFADRRPRRRDDHCFARCHGKAP